MSQVMLQFAQGNVVPLAHLSTSLVNDYAFLRREHVVGIDRALWLNEHTTGSFSERHKIAFFELERFEDLPRNDQPTVLPYAADPLLNLCCLHLLSLSEGYRKRQE
jgi:hypothetical protein